MSSRLKTPSGAKPCAFFRVKWPSVFAAGGSLFPRLRGSIRESGRQNVRETVARARFNIKIAKENEGIGAFLAIHSFQFFPCNSLISIHSCQVIHFNSFMSIHSCQFTHVNSFMSVHSFQFIHFSSFVSIYSYQFIQVIHSVQVIRFNSFISIISFVSIP